MDWISSLLLATVRLAIPLLLISLAELYGQRAGMVNIGLEGLAAIGALVGFLMCYITGSNWLGLLCGALAGMGAALLYLTGYEQWQCSSSSVPAMGFNGIAAAFLGGLNPIGSIFASFFIQHITAGGAYVDKSMYCAQISDLISALIIYLCGFVLFMKHAMNSYAAKREEKAALKARAAEAQARAEAGKGGDQ